MFMIAPLQICKEYSVDENGVVYGKRGNPIKQFLNKNGYEIVPLYFNGMQKAMQVHRLVAMTFIENPDNKPYVNHIDGNKRNNNVSNLEWVTASENIRHAIDVLGVDTIAERRRHIIGTNADTNEIVEFNSVREAAKWINDTYDVKSGCAEVWKVLNGKRKTARGYVWQYAA